MTLEEINGYNQQASHTNGFIDYSIKEKTCEKDKPEIVMALDGLEQLSVRFSSLLVRLKDKTCEIISPEVISDTCEDPNKITILKFGAPLAIKIEEMNNNFRSMADRFENIINRIEL